MTSRWGENEWSMNWRCAFIVPIKVEHINVNLTFHTCSANKIRISMNETRENDIKMSTKFYYVTKLTTLESLNFQVF